METLVDIQHWLYRGIGEGLGNVAGGDYRAVMVAMAAAILFGAVHALMPGHGKIVLISPRSAVEAANGVHERSDPGVDACRAGGSPCPSRLRGYQQGVRLRRQNPTIRGGERGAHHPHRRLLDLDFAYPSP